MVKKLYPSVVVVCLAIFSSSACTDAPHSSNPTRPPSAHSPAIMAPPYIEVAASVGLDFVHEPDLSGQFYMPEIMGSGVGLLDFDNDGDMDIYVVQSGTGLASNSGETPLQDRLYRNLLIETGQLTFEDATADAGLSNQRYGMGVAIADYDMDGFDDMFISNVGKNQLFRNMQNGTFEEVTEQSKIVGDAWSSSAAFVDFDNDGDADLYVANYVTFSKQQNIECTSEGGVRDYCGPQTYPAVPDQLFENMGNGTFRDVSKSSGIQAAQGPGLGVAISDFDLDGDVDIYVANDGAPNQMWMNSGQSAFTDTGLMSGTSLNADGTAEAGMGVMAGDFDNDGDDDLFMTHLISESNTLYANDGGGLFHDASDEVNLASASIAKTGFGAGWLDYDNDGFLDLFIANGNVKIESSRIGKSDYPFEQSNQLFRNQAGLTDKFRFKDISAAAGDAFELLEVSRGVAFGDVNNDGYTDVVVTNNNGPMRLYINQLDDNGWIGVALKDPAHRHISGARVAKLSNNKALVWRKVERAGSYLSAHDPRVRIGLGAPDIASDKNRNAAVTTSLIVQWPTGEREKWLNLQAGRYHTLVRGSGVPQ